MFEVSNVYCSPFLSSPHSSRWISRPSSPTQTPRPQLRRTSCTIKSHFPMLPGPEPGPQLVDLRAPDSPRRERPQGVAPQAEQLVLELLPGSIPRLPHLIPSFPEAAVGKQQQVALG